MNFSFVVLVITLIIYLNHKISIEKEREKRRKQFKLIINKDLR